jgi:hypothetical protein
MDPNRVGCEGYISTCFDNRGVDDRIGFMVDVVVAYSQWGTSDTER